MIGANARVRLAAKARLQRDRVSGKQFLLYPERGLELSDSAARIVQLCVGERAVAAIVDELAAAELTLARAHAVRETTRAQLSMALGEDVWRDWELVVDPGTFGPAGPGPALLIAAARAGSTRLIDNMALVLPAEGAGDAAHD